MWLYVGWLSIPHKILRHMRMAMYFWRPCVSPRGLFVSIGMCRNVWGRARAWDWNTSSRKAERERKRERALWFADYSGPHVTCLELCVASLESREWESELSKVSSIYRLPCHVTDSKHMIFFLCEAKIKCADVVGNTKHMISLPNRFPKLIDLPTSITFGLGNKWIMDPIFLEFLHHEEI